MRLLAVPRRSLDELSQVQGSALKDPGLAGCRDRPAHERAEVCIVVVATAGTLKVLSHLQKSTPFATCRPEHDQHCSDQKCMDPNFKADQLQSPWPLLPSPNMLARCVDCKQGLNAPAVMCCCCV